ncbi:MAG: hypothetical protein LBR74_03500 [Eubacterium sp.]|nr:hypothetical protein [Eubacterium sp.]
MAKKKFYILAELSKEGGRKIDNLVADLRLRGFAGTLPKSIPNHIQITTFPANDAESVTARINKAATENAKFEVEYKNVGIADKTLFLIPSVNSALSRLHDSIALSDELNWFPQTPILTGDQSELIKAALAIIPLLSEMNALSDAGKFKAVVESISIFEFNPAYLIERVKLL